MAQEVQNSVPDQNRVGLEKKLKSRFLRSAVILMTVFLLVGSGTYAWQKWLSPQAIETWKFELYQKFYVDKYENAMRQDVWGGKTPQETLDLFVAALEKGDIELASKYFALNTNENSEYYLVRDPKWLDGLRKTGELDGFKNVISKLSNVVKDEERIAGSEDFKFKLLENGEVVGYLDLGLNSYSGVWKIESM